MFKNFMRIFLLNRVAEEIHRILGFDWLMLFLQRHLHSSTVILTVRLLLQMLRQNILLTRFREATSNGGWLKETEDMLKNKEGTLLGMLQIFAIAEYDI
jgi:hypothetical protein